MGTLAINAEASHSAGCQRRKQFFWRLLARQRATLREFLAGFHHFVPSKNDVFAGHMFDICISDYLVELVSTAQCMH